MHPNPTFTRKAIYALWASVDGRKWRRDDDEVRSAHILLEEMRKKDSATAELYNVTEIPLSERDGFIAIAFSLPGVLRQWGGRVREISLDSACRSLKLVILVVPN